jgi:DNA-binding transcriptional LysR family regulator
MDSQVQAAVAVADSGSFTTAAGKLGLTPSAISKLVSKLERRLGVRLFQRTTRKVQLTEVGRRYVERARRVLLDLEELDRDVGQGDDSPRGLLKITAPPLFGEVHVLPVSTRLLRRWPELQVTLDFTDRMVDVIAEGFDIAVRFTALPTPTTWTARRLTDQRLVLVASPHYLQRHGTPRTPHELASHQHVIYSAAGRLWSTMKVRERPGSSKLITIPVNGRIQVDSSRAELEAALAGVGISDVEQYAAREHLKAGRLVELMPGYLPVERQVWLMHAPGPHVPAKVRVFVKEMLERLRDGKRSDRLSTTAGPSWTGRSRNRA